MNKPIYPMGMVGLELSATSVRSSDPLQQLQNKHWYSMQKAAADCDTTALPQSLLHEQHGEYSWLDKGQGDNLLPQLPTTTCSLQSSSISMAMQIEGNAVVWCERNMC
jgi:hypothetical protein